MQRGNRLKHWLPIPSGPCVNGLPKKPAFAPCWFAHRRNYLLFKCLMTFVALLVLTNPNIFITTWSYLTFRPFSVHVTKFIDILQRLKNHADLVEHQGQILFLHLNSQVFLRSKWQLASLQSPGCWMNVNHHQRKLLLLRCYSFYSSGDLMELAVYLI